jgi:hypothetical protein
VKILDQFVNEKGTLFLHLLAKPKEHNVGFSTVRSKTLIWTEMFLLLLCRNKNPEILNIAGHKFLEDCGLEGVTYPSKGTRGKNIKTFRNALGIDIIFGIAAANGRNKPITEPTVKSITQLTIQPIAKSIVAKPIAQPTTQPATQPTKPIQPIA